MLATKERMSASKSLDACIFKAENANRRRNRALLRYITIINKTLSASVVFFTYRICTNCYLTSIHMHVTKTEGSTIIIDITVPGYRYDEADALPLRRLSWFLPAKIFIIQAKASMAFVFAFTRSAYASLPIISSKVTMSTMSLFLVWKKGASLNIDTFLIYRRTLPFFCKDFYEFIHLNPCKQFCGPKSLS
jgi:hypothetical protein